MSDIYLIRHGFTPANNASYNGQKGLRSIAEDENMPLEIKYGRKQAEEVGKYLENIKGKVLVLASPYRRVQETLKIALSNVNFEYDLKICKELKEIGSGVHYARTKEELLSMYPEASKILDDLKIDPLGTKYLYGESQYDVRDRVRTIALKIKKISESNKYDNILIFAHGTANRWLSYWITGIYIDHVLKNGEINKISNGTVKTVFIPKTMVPLGYMVNIEKHKEL
ncbi:MAG: histidine phosphatase family protein [Bacilli bacterium]|nr:histidine phosphatase family protein [Bacilli bacterium]